MSLLFFIAVFKVLVFALRFPHWPVVFLASLTSSEGVSKTGDVGA